MLDRLGLSYFPSWGVFRQQASSLTFTTCSPTPLALAGPRKCQHLGSLNAGNDAPDIPLNIKLLSIHDIWHKLCMTHYKTSIRGLTWLGEKLTSKKITFTSFTLQHCCQLRYQPWLPKLYDSLKWRKYHVKIEGYHLNNTRKITKLLLQTP